MINTLTPSAQVEEILHFLPHLAPMISDLTIVSSSPSDRSIPSLCSFGRLRRLSLPNHLLISDLSAFPWSSQETLMHLRCSTTGFRQLLHPNPAGHFDLPSLRILQLGPTSTDDSLSLIKQLHAPCLRNLAIKVEYKDDHLTEPLAQRALLRAVSRASFVGTLTCITFTVQSLSRIPSRDAPETSTMVLDIIRPLFSLRALREVSVSYRTRDATLGTDDDILEVARAWNDLESIRLTLPASKKYDCGGFPGLDSLAHLAEHCPRLTSVSIPLVFVHPPSHVRSRDESSVWLPASHPLKSLRLKIPILALDHYKTKWILTMEAFQALKMGTGRGAPDLEPID
ncbi:hypothetical protein BD309DRAFT_1001392 [Dichomitus squalens]|nr:hypothetical protein BD309DRAFT_1001392 [Dichomitus squalens]